MPKGDFQLARGLATREAIRHYFTTHPCCHTKDCASALGLRQSTVSIHATRIRREWRGNLESAE